MAQITYADKAKINDSSLPAINKVRDVDMNEIKEVVNENYEEQQNIVTNGTGYVKYNDGTLICYGKTTKVNINASSEYSENITLPQAYLSSDFTVLASVTSGGSGWGSIIARGGATDTNKIRIIAGNYIQQYTASDIVLSYITIGKWK